MDLVIIYGCMVIGALSIGLVLSLVFDWWEGK